MVEECNDIVWWMGVLLRIGVCYVNLGEINKVEELWWEILVLEIVCNDLMGIGR